VRSQAVIDTFPVLAEWRWVLICWMLKYQPKNGWRSTCVRVNTYCKLWNAECCTPMVSALKKFYQMDFSLHLFYWRFDSWWNCGKFLPLFPLLLIWMAPVGSDNLDSIPYNFCCLTMKSYITNSLCGIYNLYFPSNVMVAEHKRQLHPRVKPALHPV